jgi:hypothetical protein
LVFSGVPLKRLRAKKNKPESKEKKKLATAASYGGFLEISLWRRPPAKRS